MGKGPGLYTEMEKRPEEMGSARKEYEFLSEIGLSSHNLGNHVGGKRLGNGPVVSTLNPANYQVKNKNFTANINVASYSSDIPGLKAIIVSAKVELQNLHPHAGICTSVGFTVNPIINLSSVIGTNLLALGTDVSFDTESGNFKHFNAGVSFSKDDLVASFTLNDKGERLDAPYYHVVNPQWLELSTLLDPLTAVKARVNNAGIANALIQYEWRPKSFITISGEVYSKAIEKRVKVGFALALKP
ncbi:Mitochondrial outer membrane protein porin 3 [Raphanus sativus]|nr:Mitochondrial outer membrane protein porin 3 [Raphanus sativus]